jgi:hypothetical protein
VNNKTVQQTVIAGFTCNLDKLTFLRDCGSSPQ